MNCSNCEKQISSAFTPAGVEKLLCDDCRREQREKRRSNCLVKGCFEKMDDDGNVIRRKPEVLLTDEQVKRYQNRIDAKKLRCVSCRKRQDCQSSWIDAKFSDLSEEASL